MIKRFFPQAVLFIIILSLVCSCATRTPPRWEYEQDAITISLEADNQLNFRDGISHTLSVCIYQLKDPNTFHQLSDDTDGIYQLLDCSIFDASVAVTKRLIVNPNQALSVSLDRAEGAKYVAVVAGYYTIEKDKILRFYKIPVKKKGLGGKYVPKKLDVRLVLGPKQILTPKGE
jgi:type VI secretion system VasD/TssJ family lipoprotein